MPDVTLSNRLRELWTVYPPNAREIMTLELRQRPVDLYDELDLVFVVDSTSTMGTALDLLSGALTGLAASISDEFTSIRAAVVSFKDELETVTHLGFTTLSAAATSIGALSVSGGGDSADNGFGALRHGARLEWRQEAARVIVLWTDSDSHARGCSFQRAKIALNFEEVVLLYGGGTVSDYYESLAVSTLGAQLTGSTTSTLRAQIASQLNAIANPVEPPVYLVNDNENFVATLENGVERTFLRRSFALDPFSSGEEGVIGIPLTVDNSDLAVSRYIDKAKRFNFPLDIVIRIYDSLDTSGPQNNPPLRLFASDFEISRSVVSCRLTGLDLQNAAFPNAYYDPRITPSLQ